MICFFFLLLSLVSFASNEIKCEATYDQMGITHQKVRSVEEYYFCFGYHHGRDRAWEMDYFLRTAQGRNSEIYGFSSLKSDLMMRLLDLPALASRIFKELPDLQKSWLESYAKGANLGFVEGKKAREFLDLEYTPQEWKAEYSILLLVLQSFDQTRKTFTRDYEEEKFKEHWKDQTAKLFEEDTNPWFNTILKSGEYSKGSVKTQTTSSTIPLPELWANFPQVFGKESGSNNWVVSKQKSKNGFAMLANDPHLDLKTPLFWYWINIQSPEQHAMGASLPGVPVIVSGTNGKVAWGLTNSYMNSADLVFVKDLKKSDIVTFRPTVDVKLGFFKVPFFLKSFEKTKEGDLIIPLELEAEEKLVLRWTGFQLKGSDLLPMFSLVHAKTVSEMDAILLKVGLPAWNFVFADSSGDIGYRMVGQVYQQESAPTYGVARESMDQFRSTPLLENISRPSVLKPKRHYVYTANNRHWPLDSKFHGGRAYSYSFRASRIDEELKSQKQDVKSFQNLQCDRQALDAIHFVPRILKNADIAEFKNWDFQTSDESLAPSIYRRLMDLLMEGWQVNEYALFNLLNNLDEKKKSELMSFYNVAKQQVDGRTWSKIHRLYFSHLSQNKEWIFSPELPGFGDNHSVDPGTSKWDPDKKIYDHYSGASMRMIVVLKKQPEIHLSLPGLNRNYTTKQDNLPVWSDWHSCHYQQVTY